MRGLHQCGPEFQAGALRETNRLRGKGKSMEKLDVLSLINPQMKAILAKEDELAGDANDTSVGFEVMRENYILGRQYWVQGGPQMKESFDETVEGPNGPVPIRFYYPTQETLDAKEAKEGKVATIVYVHGGGFVLGNLDTHDRICRVLADDAQAIVVAVDYHLAPEAKYPSQIQEVCAVLTHLHENGAEYGIDGDRLAMAGDSGGAHLNLASTLYYRDKIGDASFIKALLLYYGSFGLRDSNSHRLLGGPWDGLEEKDLEFYMTLYGGDFDKLIQEQYFNLYLNDFTHDMPALYIAAAEYDPLIDDSDLLATIAEQSGVPYQYEVFEGVIHAFLHYTRALDAANDALEHGATFFGQVMGIPEEGLQ